MDQKRAPGSCKKGQICYISSMEKEQNIIRRGFQIWENTVCKEEVDLLTRYALHTLESGGLSAVHRDLLYDTKRFAMICRRWTAAATGIGLGLTTQGVLAELSFQALGILIPTSIFVLICNAALDYPIKGNLEEK